jgi:hypothetical protein
MWTWSGKMGLLCMEATTRWQLRLCVFPHARVLKFLEDEQSDMHLLDWNKSKNLAPQEKIEKSIIKRITLDILGVLQFLIFWIFDILNDISHLLM